MITERKFLAVTLASAIFTFAPMFAWSQTQASRAAAGIGSIGAMTPAPLTVLAPPAVFNAGLSAPALALPAVPVAMRFSAPTIALPVAKQSLAAMARAVDKANKTGSPVKLGRIFDAEHDDGPDAVLLPDGGWYAGLNQNLSSKDYETVRDGALAAVARARAAGRRRLNLVVDRTRKEGWSEALLLNPQDPRAEEGVLSFLSRISDLQNTTHLDAVVVQAASPLSGRPTRARAVLPKGGWYAGLNESLSQDNYSKVLDASMAALDRAADAGDDVLAVKIDRTGTEGYSELLLLNPRKLEQARAGLRLFLESISDLQNTTHLDSVSIVRRTRR